MVGALADAAPASAVGGADLASAETDAVAGKPGEITGSEVKSRCPERVVTGRGSGAVNCGSGAGGSAAGAGAGEGDAGAGVDVDVDVGGGATERRSG